MNKRQWFHGQLEGQYVGHPKPAEEQATTSSGEHYRIEINRAVVSAIELVAETTDPEPDDGESESHLDGEAAKELPAAAPTLEIDYHHQAEGAVFHQAVIAQSFFLEAMGPGKTVRGAAYDVLVSELSFTHPARKEGKSYGRVCGTVSGWFRPLPRPEPVEEVAPPERPGEVWRTEVLAPSPSTARPLADSLASAASSATAAQAGSSEVHLAPSLPQNEGDEPELAEHQQDEDSIHATTDLPFFTIGTLLAVALFLLSGATAAGIWYACFLPALGLRRWLYEVVPDGWFIRALALGLMAAQLLTTALLLASWQEAGCKALGPFSLFFLGGSLFVSCLLPRAPSFAVAATCLAAVLGQFFGPLSELCR